VPSASDGDDLDEVAQAVEVIGVTCVQREFGGERGRSNEQIEGAPIACLATR
jgi:hypothetical protein